MTTTTSTSTYAVFPCRRVGPPWLWRVDITRGKERLSLYGGRHYTSKSAAMRAARRWIRRIEEAPDADDDA